MNNGVFACLIEKPIGWISEVETYGQYKKAVYYSLQNIRLSWLFGKSVYIAGSTGILFLSAFQSIISLILITMTIISIRKRFKI